MTPKEKYQELFYKFNTITSKEFKSDTVTSASAANECVRIAVEEMKEMLPFPNDEWKYERISFLDEVLTHLNT
jgi:hypothetical protein